MSTVPKLHRTQALDIFIAIDIARSQPGYIVNRKLETKSTGRFSLFWPSYLDLHLIGHKKKSKSNYTSKRQFKYDQFVYHKDKGDLIVVFEQSQL